MEDLVTLLVPAYNAERTIELTLRSLCNQTYRNIKIIVVDNASTDRTAEIASGIDDARIQVHRMTLHVPYAEGNWNRSLQFAEGTYTMICHADDIYLPEMVELQVKAFNEHSVVGMVATRGYVINASGKRLGEFRLPDAQLFDYSHLLTATLQHTDFIPTPTVMMYTELYKRLAPFRYHLFRSASDLDMWLRASYGCFVYILPERLVEYRVHTGQSSVSVKKLRTEESDFFRVLDYHLNRYTGVIDRSALVRYQLYRTGDLVIRMKQALKARQIRTLIRLACSGQWTRDFLTIVSNWKDFRACVETYRYHGVFR